MPGPLDGVRVLDITHIVAGPFGGLLLGDLGADVIKIEPVWGEPQRQTMPFVPNETRSFISLNRSKRSIPLDLTKSDGLEILYKLVDTADALIINARPDVPYKLGIDYETLSARNPRLIYCENTTYGRKGPLSHLPGSDIVTQGLSGMIAAQGVSPRRSPAACCRVTHRGPCRRHRHGLGSLRGPLPPGAHRQGPEGGHHPDRDRHGADDAPFRAGGPR